jgi:ElaB/YqjD/DUF883 family membrane-anchored ribosome-binding protein
VHLVDQGREAARQEAAQWKVRARGWEHAARSYVEREPVKATLVAMAAGAALALLSGSLLRGRGGPR